jgi:hypothetical protein
MDCFHLIGLMTLLAAPLVLARRRFKLGVMRQAGIDPPSWGGRVP